MSRADEEKVMKASFSFDRFTSQISNTLFGIDYFSYIRNDWIDDLRDALRQGKLSVNYKNDRFGFLLEHAISMRRVNIAVMLLQHGADPNATRINCGRQYKAVEKIVAALACFNDSLAKLSMTFGADFSYLDPSMKEHFGYFLPTRSEQETRNALKVQEDKGNIAFDGKEYQTAIDCYRSALASLSSFLDQEHDKERYQSQSLTPVKYENQTFTSIIECYENRINECRQKIEQSEQKLGLQRHVGSPPPPPEDDGHKSSDSYMTAHKCGDYNYYSSPGLRRRVLSAK